MMEVFILKFQSIAEFQIPEIFSRWYEIKCGSSLTDVHNLGLVASQWSMKFWEYAESTSWGHSGNISESTLTQIFCQDF